MEKPAARAGLQALYKARKKENLSWVVSPLKGLKGKELKFFHVRHEASMLELFFDLFFVANLATFTAYHDITTGGEVLAYIGFFGILWSTWFQITIFDVRFAADSTLERTCKLFQFISFAIFAAVGANFNPGTYYSIKYYRIYQLAGVILGFTRFLLAFQYILVAFMVCRQYKRLILPFILIILTFLVSGTCLATTFVGFNDKAISNYHIVWWIVLPVESIIILTISSFWRMLSFKETHMNERLSLLTMIIIGEGVIGVTKTVGYLWPADQAPTTGNVLAVLAIVVMLLLMWQIYFDNHPHGDYGTIAQQWWAFSHFFLHLSIVGVVEGSNRMAVIYYATTVYTGIYNQITALCSVAAPDRALFVSSMNQTLEYLKLDTYDPRNYDNVYYYLNQTLYPRLSPNFCNITDVDSEAVGIDYYLTQGTFKRFGIKAAKRDAAYYHTFITTYVYLWISVASTMILLLVFLWIVRKNKHDSLEVVRMSARLVIAVVAIAIVCLNFMEVPFDAFISSPWVVATICVLMGLTLTVDRICRFLGVVSFGRYYALPVEEVKDHRHGEDDGKEDESLLSHTSTMAFGGDRTSMMSLSATTYENEGVGYEMVPGPLRTSSGTGFSSQGAGFYAPPPMSPEVQVPYHDEIQSPGMVHQDGGEGSWRSVNDVRK